MMHTNMNGFHLVLIAAALVLAPLGAETAAAEPSGGEAPCRPVGPSGPLCVLEGGCVVHWWDFCLVPLQD